MLHKIIAGLALACAFGLPAVAQQNPQISYSPAGAAFYGIGLGSALGQGSIAIVSGGTGYVVGEQVTLACAGATFSTSPVIVVNAVSGGVITGSQVTITGVTSAVSVGPCTFTQASTSGSGTGASWTGNL